MSELWWFHYRDERIEFGFTDARSDFGLDPNDKSESGRLVRDLLDDDNVEVVLMRQVHGNTVADAKGSRAPEADALVVDRAGIAAVVRVADCVPIVLAANDVPLAAVVHAGRAGMVSGVVPATVERMRELGAMDLRAWIGPRVCGACYELPAELVDEIAAVEPITRSRTTWGTTAVDVAAGVRAQLGRAGVEYDDLGAEICTLEDDRFWSHRRQGDEAGRFGAVVRLLEES